jgi:hypothetical protein
VNTRSKPGQPKLIARLVKPATSPRPVRRPTRQPQSPPMQPRVTARVSSEQASRPCRECRFPQWHIIRHRPKSVRRRSQPRKRRLSQRPVRWRDHRLEIDSINQSGVTSPRHHCLAAQDGRAPDHAGSASHSAHRIRRSSLPTLTKTKGASSRPVFEPTNIAGTPPTSLMIAVFAIPTPAFC